MTTDRFDPASADPRWQAAWDQAQTFKADDSSPKPRSYVLEMFPYPSGRIHIGHVRNYTMGDVLARTKRMQGFEVLHPMGWDAFGMPAENAAMEKGVHPGGWTRENIANMKAQLKRLGFALDWSRELATCEPDYYGQEQALFLDLYAAGLVYRKESAVNWDPVDMTVLANEQVIDGRGWRSGALVEKRKLNQWFLKITQFADDLLSGLGELKNWPEKVRLMQENWIGKSQGLKCTFRFPGSTQGIEVYTTRPDTMFGASFVAIAADHPFARKIAETVPELAAFIEECKQGGTTAAELETAEKKGFNTGYSVEHPLKPSWHLPVYVANFVLMDYGTGAVFGCPAHDQRDLDFARKYDLPVTRVVAEGDDTDPVFRGNVAYTGPGRIVNSEWLDGMTVEQAKADVIAKHARRLGPRGNTVPPARLGRQPPALLGHADPVHPLRKLRGGAGAQGPVTGHLARGCGLQEPRQPAAAPPDLAPCRLPEVWRASRARDRYARHVRGLVVVLPALCQPAVRPPVRSRSDQAMATGRAIYRRDRTRDPALALCPVLDPGAQSHRPDRREGTLRQPVHARDGDARDLFADRSGQRPAGLFQPGRSGPRRRYGDLEGRWPAGRDRPRHQDVQEQEERRRSGRHHCPVRRRCGALVHAFGQPARARPALVRGRDRRLRPLRPAPVAPVRAIRRRRHRRGQGAGSQARPDCRCRQRDIAALSFNKAVARIYELASAIDKAAPSASRSAAIRVLLLLVSPMMPHLAEEAWTAIGGEGLVADAPWPPVDPALLVEDEVTIAIQVLGKLRDTVTVAKGTPKEELEALALASEKVQRALDGKAVKKVIVVPDRLVNLVA